MTALILVCIFIALLGLVAMDGAYESTQRANRAADHYKAQWKAERMAHHDTKVALVNASNDWFHKGVKAATERQTTPRLRVVADVSRREVES